MAAPPKITAPQMKQAQARKLSERTAELTTLLRPFTDRLIKDLEGKLQLAMESIHPTPDVRGMFIYQGRFPGEDLALGIAVFTNIVTTNFTAGGRNFTVTSTNDAAAGRLDFVLTW